MHVLLLPFACLLALAWGQVSDQELLDISNDIWDDPNNMAAYVDYNTNGGYIFDSVDEGRLAQGTYGLLQNLMSHYNPVIGEADNCGPGSACFNAQEDLLDSVMASPPMTKLHTFLASKGLASSSAAGFRAEIRQYFFLPYSRSQGSAIDSSGFEHVFLGEVRNSEVTGFHGWVQTYLLEKSGAFRLNNYQATCYPDVAKFGFSWTHEGRTYTKSISSISIGSSVEAEMALYALCFQARQTSSCRVSLDGQPTTVTTYSMSGVSPRTIGTSYIAC